MKRSIFLLCIILILNFTKNEEEEFIDLTMIIFQKF